MKKLLFFFVSSVLLIYSLQAQQKGDLMIGAGGLPVIYPDNSLPTGYSVRANFNFFPVDRFAIGIMPFAGKVDEITGIGVHGHMRYYFTDSRLSIFGDVGFGFGAVRYDILTELDGTMSSVVVGPGLSYKLGGRLAVEAIFQYARLQNISYPENAATGNTFLPTIGLQYYIKKKD